MATLISSTNVKLTELQTAPAGGGAFTGSNLRFDIIARYGWNNGTAGAGTYSLFTWGYGFGAGGGNLDAIYGLNPPGSGTNPPLTLGDWKGLQYWFDGTTFDITWQGRNNLPNPVFPTPPSANDVNIDVYCYDSSGTYAVFNSWSNNFPANTLFGSSQIPGFTPDASPLVKDVYWKVDATTDPVNWAGGTLDIEINGVNVLNYGLQPGANNLDWSMGNVGATNASGILFDFIIT